MKSQSVMMQRSLCERFTHSFCRLQACVFEARHASFCSDSTTRFTERLFESVCQLQSVARPTLCTQDILLLRPLAHVKLVLSSRAGVHAHQRVQLDVPPRPRLDRRAKGTAPGIAHS